VGTEASATDAVAREEAELGRRLDLVHVFHVGGEDWPTPSELALVTDAASPRTLLVNWKPESGATWAQVAAGAADATIDAAAARVVARLGGRPFFLTIHHEPENEVGGAGSGYSPADYVAMYRYVVTRLRADGVTNAVTVWDVMGYSGWGDQGLYPALYPGDDVVDWIGYDPYTNDGSPLSAFVNRAGQNFPGFYSWATTAHPGKPLMLAEFGVAAPAPAARAAVFATLAAQAAAFPALKAFVYFNHRPDSTTGGQDYSFDDDQGVLAAATKAFGDPYFTP
jgi:beta-mannanase